MHTFTGIARIGMYIGGLWYQIFLSASQRSFTCPSVPVSRILYSEVLINFDILSIYVLCARILAQKTVIQMFSFHEPPTNQNEQGPNKYNHAMQKYLVQIPGQLFLVSSMIRQVSVDFSINGQISCAVIWCVLYGEKTWSFWHSETGSFSSFLHPGSIFKIQLIIFKIPDNAN